jgi:hypothetical protein
VKHKLRVLEAEERYAARHEDRAGEPFGTDSISARSAPKVGAPAADRHPASGPGSNAVAPMPVPRR